MENHDTLRKNDRQLHQEILRELERDPRVDPTCVGVEVRNGIVTLSGTTDSYAKRTDILEAVYRVGGALDIVNDLKVDVPGDMAVTDQEIAELIRQSLMRDPLISQEKILTTVSHGWVTLRGEVPCDADRERAQRLVGRIRGVGGISNELTIEVTAIQIHQLRSKIEEALGRRARREAERLSIDEKDGTVTLKGVVNNWDEKRAVLGIIEHAPGVHKVEDHLVIGAYNGFGATE